MDKGPSKIRGNIHIQSCHTYWPRPNSRYQIKSLADTAWQKWVYKTTFKKIFNKKNSAMFTFSHLPYYSWYFYLFFFFFFLISIQEVLLIEVWYIFACLLWRCGGATFRFHAFEWNTYVINIAKEIFRKVIIVI